MSLALQGGWCSGQKIETSLSNPVAISTPQPSLQRGAKTFQLRLPVPVLQLAACSLSLGLAPPLAQRPVPFLRKQIRLLWGLHIPQSGANPEQSGRPLTAFPQLLQ